MLNGQSRQSDFYLDLFTNSALKIQVNTPKCIFMMVHEADKNLDWKGRKKRHTFVKNVA